MFRLPRRGVIALTALATISHAATSPARSAPADEWRLVGTWETIANADDVQALARDGDRIWAGTAHGGVARWGADGRTVRQYLAPQDGLPCNDVHDVVRWQGEWWFATCAGLAVYDPGHDRMEAVAADLPSGAVTSLAVDDGGRLWVGTTQAWDPRATFPGQSAAGGWTGGGVAYTDNGRDWVVLGAAGGLPSSNVQDLAAWRGAVWAATEPYRSWKPPSEDPDGNPQPGRWETLGGGVAQRAGDRWIRYDSGAVPELSDNVRALAGDSRALWVATGGRGLVAFDGGTWKALMDCGVDTRCIQDNFVTAVTVGPDGAVWAGTSRFNGRGTGLNALDPRGTPTDPSDDAWHVLRAADGLPGERVGAILAADDASVWLGTAVMDPEGRLHGQGLTHLLGDRQTFVTARAADIGGGTPADNDVTALARNPVTGALWVGMARAGLSVREPSGRWHSYTRQSTSGGLASDSVADIAIEPSGVVWVATRETTFDAVSGSWVDGGLSRFDGARWSTLAGPESGLPSDHLSALALDGRGKLWVGTGATDRGPKEHAYRGWGLAVVDTASSRWERTFTFPTLTSNNVTDIVVAGKEVWVSTAYFFYVDTRPGGAQFSTGGGVSVYDLDLGRWRKLGAAEGLTVAAQGRGASLGQGLLDHRSVFVDGAGTAWVGGQAYPGGAYEPDERADGVIDAVRGGRATGERFPGAGPVVALAADPAGNLWAASAVEGVRVRAANGWIDGVGRDLVPLGGVSNLSLDGGEVWLATAGQGLARLVPPAQVAGTVPGGSPPPIVARLARRVFLPVAHRQTRPPVYRPPGHEPSFVESGWGR